MARSIFISQIRDTGNILAGLTTANLVEGSNLYFTNARVYSNVIALLPTLAGSGIQIQANGQINSSATLTLASLSPFLTTSNVSEGSNLYYTNARVRSTLSSGTGVSYDNSTGAISIGQNVSSTADVTFANLTVSGDLVVQGNTVTLNASTVNIEDKNLLLANGAINAAAADGAGITIYGANANITYVNATNSWNLNKDIIVTSNVTANIFNGNLVGNATGTAGTLSNFTTANLAEGSALYYTNARVYSNVIALLPTLAGSGIQIQANGQINSNTSLTLATLSPFLTTSNVSEGSNLYYTNARVLSALTGADISPNSISVTRTVIANTFIKSNYPIIAPTKIVNKGTGVLSANTLAATTSTAGPTGIVTDPSGRFVYVTNQTAATVGQYSINQVTGILTSITTDIATGSLPKAITIDPTGRFVYVANQTAATISQYSINQGSGALTSITSAIATGAGTQGITTDPTGRFVYTTGYTVGTVSMYSIDQSTGALTSITSAIATGTNPFGVAVDPTGRFVYVVNFTSATVSMYSIDQSTGALTSITTAVAAGANPRYITVDPTGRFVYVANNGAATISQYSINQITGALTSITSAIASGTTTRGLVVDPTGRFLYASNQGESTVSQYSINQSTGALSSISTAISTGLDVQGLVVDPTGRFVYTVGQSDETINLHVINNFSIGLLSSLNVTGNVNSGNVITTRIQANTWTGIFTANVIESGSNLYYTNARVNSNVIAFLPSLAGQYITIQANGQISSNLSTDATIVIEANGQIRSNSTGITSLAAFTTANLAEGGANLYFTNARVLAAVTGAGVLRSYVNSYKGNSQSNTIALVVAPISNNYVTVIINGVAQLSNAYTVTGNVLTFTGFPATNADIDVRIIDVGQPLARDINSRLFYGDGSANVASISNNFSESTILVFENGIAQVPGIDYIASGGVLRFTTPPRVGVVVEIRELPTISSNNIYTGGRFTSIQANGQINSNITAGQNITISANGQINATVQEQIHPFLLSLL